MQALGNLLKHAAQITLSISRRSWFSWLRIYRQQGRRGKLVFGCGSFLGACFILTLCSSLILPPGVPEEEIVEESRSEEIDLDDEAEAEAVAQAAERPTETAATDPTEPAATATSTLAPTVEPTETLPPTSTNTPKPTNTRPPTNTPQPTNTAVPPTNTRPPATAVPPTAVPPTAVPLPTNTPAPTAVPTEPPAPTQPPPPSSSLVEIIGVNKQAEYVDIRNNNAAAVDLAGWVLVSEKGNQACGLGGVLQAGATLRIYALAADAGLGGYNCNFGSPIWNNSEPDPAVLYDNTGAEVDRW